MYSTMLQLLSLVTVFMPLVRVVMKTVIIKYFDIANLVINQWDKLPPTEHRHDILDQKLIIFGGTDPGQSH